MADNSSRTSIPQSCSDQITVSQVRATLDQWYPPSLAESWDAPGLVCGDPDEAVGRIACALEATDAVVDAAIEACLLYTSPSPRDGLLSRMPSSA